MKQKALDSNIQRRLSDWFESNARDLPWRRSRDPYVIWVSEIMLQQTQVETVIPYFEAFIRRFPNVGSLARARLDTVLKLWEGMGYYARARNMHIAARNILSGFSGRFPQRTEALQSLAGIGKYTAGAIASIAFGQDEPAVDGNATRVLCRVFRIRQHPKAARTQKRLWSIAKQLVPAQRAGTFNQALMELGATVCTPRNPDCMACPLAALCKAHAAGQQEKLPLRSAPKAMPKKTFAVAVIEVRGNILISKRVPKGLLGGLWEFPGVEIGRGQTPQAKLKRRIRDHFNIKIELQGPTMVFRQAYSHFVAEFHVYRCRRLSGKPNGAASDPHKWVCPQNLGRYAFSRAHQIIRDAIRERQKQ